MARSLLAAVRSACTAAPSNDSQEREATGAADAALETTERPVRAETERTGMSDQQGKPAAVNQAGISEADHNAAVTAARAEGEAAGVTATNERFAAVMGAEGVKGDAAKTVAAIDLAIRSPGMAAGDVAAFVAENVSTQAAAPAVASLAGRIGEAGGGLPPADAPAAKSGLSRAVDAHVATLNR